MGGEITGIRGGGLRRIGRYFLYALAGAAAIGAFSRMATKKPPVDIEINSRCRGANCTVIIKAPEGTNFLANHPRLEAGLDCKILDVDVTKRALRARVLESNGRCDLSMRYLDKDWTFTIE